MNFNKQKHFNLIALVFTIIMLNSCHQGVEGEIIENKIDKNDFIVMKLNELKRKYSKEIIEQYNFNLALGCSPYLKFVDLKQLKLVNLSIENELRFTILKTIKKYPLSNKKDTCFEPVLDIFTTTSDTDFITLEPGDRKKLGAKEYYEDGHFIKVEYKITGAKKNE